MNAIIGTLCLLFNVGGDGMVFLKASLTSKGDQFGCRHYWGDADLVVRWGRFRYVFRVKGMRLVK